MGAKEKKNPLEKKSALFYTKFRKKPPAEFYSINALPQFLLTLYIVSLSFLCKKDQREVRLRATKYRLWCSSRSAKHNGRLPSNFLSVLK